VLRVEEGEAGFVAGCCCGCRAPGDTAFPSSDAASVCGVAGANARESPLLDSSEVDWLYAAGQQTRIDIKIKGGRARGTKFLEIKELCPQQLRNH
jgi:hypothetical protein